MCLYLKRPDTKKYIMLSIFIGLILCCSQVAALVVLQYHHVSNATPPATSTSPERFGQHLQWLKDKEYQVWSMQQLISALADRQPLPDKTVVITFDDGYSSIFTTAWPMLKRYQWPFTVFVNSQHHDEKNAQYMSWDEIKMLAAAGVVIGNHSVSHAHLVRYLPGETHRQWQQRVRQEITGAQERIDAELGRQPRTFAYPFGEHNSELQNILKNLGYVAFGQHSGPISELDDRQVLPRFPFGGIYGDAEDFATKASSRPLPVAAVELRDKRQKILQNPLLADDTDYIQIKLTGDPELLKSVNCFYGGEPGIKKLSKNVLIVHNPQPIKPGRSRFNCTAKNGDSFYWLSKMVMKKNLDGSWYSEY